MGSIVERAGMLRKLSFPRLIIPMSRTVGVAITFAVNLTIVGAFVAWSQIPPRWNWILLLPLLAELYIFTLGVTLILATIFVRLRDIGQVWELFLQLLFYATPIIYPIGFLPPWARTVAFLSPLTQVLQDIRAIVLYQDVPDNRITAAEALQDYGGRLLPVCIAVGLFVVGLLLSAASRPGSRSAYDLGGGGGGSGDQGAEQLPPPAADHDQGAFLHPFRRVTYETQRALDDVSFAIEPGEFFGIIGPNGSGKSTLLKILAGIYRQDSGTVRVEGLLSPFIELGVGFNLELNARDDVRVNGTLLGLSRRQLEARFDDVIGFAELERFVDQQLKLCSSGMLRFGSHSIAIQVEFDILLLDEVLAVGDQAFQEKYFGTFDRFREEGETIVYVARDLPTVERFCDRVLLLAQERCARLARRMKSSRST